MVRFEKERKKTDPREGWEDGTPPPHRDFKARHAVRGQLVFIRFSRRVLSIFFLRILSVFLSKIGSIFSNMARIWLQIGPIFSNILYIPAKNR